VVLEKDHIVLDLLVLKNVKTLTKTVIVQTTSLEENGNVKKNTMDTQDLKVLMLNTSAFTLSMTSVEDILKIILLLVSIGFTVARWYEIHKRNKDNK
jgi:hypothetical protein